MANKKSNNISTITLTPENTRVAITSIIEAALDVNDEFKHDTSQKTDNKLATFIWGPPGIGKSQLFKQIAKHFGMDLIDVRLSQMDPTDIRGIPVPMKVQVKQADGTTREEEQVVWLPPAMFPQDPNAKAIILLDELNTAPQTVQAAAYQLVLDRKIGEYTLPDGVFVFAAGNRDTDKGATFKMPLPLMNRFCHLEMEPSFDDWQNWALKVGLHRDVVGYVSFQKGSLFNFDSTSASRSFPTPRSWEFVSKYLSGRNTKSMPTHIVTAMVAGCVGTEAAAAFMTYRENAANLPNPSDIINGKVTSVKNPDAAVCYALTTGLCYELKNAYDYEGKLKQEKSPELAKVQDDNDAKLNNMMVFCHENFSPEFNILAMRTILRTYNISPRTKKLPAWKTFTERYSKMIINA